MSADSVGERSSSELCDARLKYLEAWAMSEVHSSGYDDMPVGLSQQGSTVYPRDIIGGGICVQAFQRGDQIAQPPLLPEDRDV